MLIQQPDANLFIYILSVADFFVYCSVTFFKDVVLTVSLTLPTFLSPSSFLSNPYLLCFYLCSHYGLSPPSLAQFLCSSSWQLRLCSSLLFAFLVRYSFSFLNVSPLRLSRDACLLNLISKHGHFDGEKKWEKKFILTKRHLNKPHMHAIINYPIQYI